LKILIISREVRSRSFDTLFDGLSQIFDTDVVKLSKGQIQSFDATLEQMDFRSYERVLIDVPLRRIGKNYRALKKVPGLILYEEDACQELVPRSEYYRRFSKIYKKIGCCKVVVTSYYLQRFFLAQGLDVAVVPKAYDDGLLKDLNVTRDIEVGFIGRVKNKVYRKRSRFLKELNKAFDISIMKTEPGEEYLQALNRIKIFVSADIGYEEYMAKNFEAMACGCLLLAKRQTEEEASLGLLDGVNVVLYDDFNEARKKLAELLREPDRAQRIAKEGLALVQNKHKLSHRIDDFSNVITADIREYKANSFWQRLFKV